MARKRVGPNSIAAHDGVAKTDALILRIFEAKQFMKLMEHTGLEGVVADYAEFQSCLPANSRVVYLILNAHAYYSRYAPLRTNKALKVAHDRIHQADVSCFTNSLEATFAHARGVMVAVDEPPSRPLRQHWPS